MWHFRVKVVVCRRRVTGVDRGGRGAVDSSKFESMSSAIVSVADPVSKMARQQRDNQMADRQAKGVTEFAH